MQREGQSPKFSGEANEFEGISGAKRDGIPNSRAKPMNWKDWVKRSVARVPNSAAELRSLIRMVLYFAKES